MHYKTKSLVTIIVAVVIMVGLGFTLNSFRNSQVTGAAVADECHIACRAPIDCFDGDKCTEDVCVLPYDCNSYCENPRIPGCS
ncbi:hypothetical protein KY328_02510 [Candidatus Woesearchaeota archaeon]|nr:hypothetical protein [Candidatus Woesearchaeota archaeon]MBW3021764.1 hypothetical protein [Candidatus Woesearchaeota archaeon]